MPGKSYWLTAFWLASVAVVGIGGFLAGGAEGSSGFLAAIGEAFHNTLGAADSKMVEIVDVDELSSEGAAKEARVLVGADAAPPSRQKGIEAEPCSVGEYKNASESAIIFNEIAWMGGLESQDLSYSDEWIELRNISSETVDVGGWQIMDAGGDISVVLPGGSVIAPGGFFLLERSDDGSVPGVIADLIYTGTLANEEESLKMLNKNCLLIDEVGADPNWPAGDGPNRRTMERSDDLSWHTFNGSTEEGILGTPKAPNSEGAGEEDTEIGEEKQVSVKNFSQCTKKSGARPTLEVLINEVAWAGRADNTSEEWIELRSPRGRVSLEGWQLLDRERSVAVIFGKEDIDGYYLLRRILASDDPNGDWRVGNIRADKTYTGVIQNSDEGLQLFNRDCVLIDEVEDVGTNWKNIGGSASPEYRSAERTNENGWHTYSGSGESGIMGTPRGENSEPPKSGAESVQSTSGGGSSASEGGTTENGNCPQDDLNEPTRIVLINEVAWAGSASSTSQEWIELYTDIDRGLSLSGWQLLDKDGEIQVNLSGRIEDFLLLRRILASDDPGGLYLIGAVAADLTFTGTINNDGETLRLFDASCNLVDEVVDVGNGWKNIGGSASPEYRTAERVDINTWGTYEGEGDIMGTPRAQNSLLAGMDEDEGEEADGGNGGSGEEDGEADSGDGDGTDAGVDQSAADLTITGVIYDVEGADEGQERITITNNGTSTVDISGFSIQYLKSGGEISSVGKKNFEPGHEIAGSGEFVVGANCTGAVPCEGVNMSWSQALGNDGGTVYLVLNQDKIESNEDGDIMSLFNY